MKNDSTSAFTAKWSGPFGVGLITLYASSSSSSPSPFASKNTVAGAPPPVAPVAPFLPPSRPAAPPVWPPAEPVMAPTFAASGPSAFAFFAFFAFIIFAANASAVRVIAANRRFSASAFNTRREGFNFPARASLVSSPRRPTALSCASSASSRASSRVSLASATALRVIGSIARPFSSARARWVALVSASSASRRVALAAAISCAKVYKCMCAWLELCISLRAFSVPSSTPCSQSMPFSQSSLP